MDRLPERMARSVGTNWIGPGGHVVHYPVRAGSLMNFVGALERADWQVESWSTRGTTEEMAADFAGWNEDVQTMIRNIETPYKWALMVRPPMARWTLGRASLLDRKSTRLNSSHRCISYAVFCVKKKSGKSLSDCLAAHSQAAHWNRLACSDVCAESGRDCRIQATVEVDHRSLSCGGRRVGWNIC